MKNALLDIAAATGGGKWVQMYEILEHTMIEATGIKPNLDFPTGPAYFLLGFDIEVFTPIFVMSRITGWTAHVIEQGAGRTRSSARHVNPTPSRPTSTR
ncbi:Probable citrate synthase [Mycobacteroides abscessus subsp. abscessus]|nr:Probable citrate synthase [Mycobacteroides abscessus subsp. abscessus]